MRRQGPGNTWIWAGVTSLVLWAPSGAVRAAGPEVIDLTVGSPSSSGVPETIDLTAAGSSGRTEQGDVIDLTGPRASGSLEHAETVDLTASQASGRLEQNETFDLTDGGSPGRVEKNETFDLTAGGPPGRVEKNETFDLTAGGPPGLQDDEDLVDLTGADSTVSPSGSALASSSLPSAYSVSIEARSIASQKAAVEAPLPERSTVVRVIDGDTYEIEGGFRVRLSGVNTPEKKERIGPQVGEAVRNILLHKEVTLAYGATSRDHYGRLIADVKLNGKSVAEILLREGLGHMFIVPPTRPEDYEAMAAAEREARAANRGIWSEERYRGSLHITSFHANAPGDDRTNPNGEYLRIANTSGRDLSLAGFSLSNEHGKKLMFPDLVVPAGYTFQVFSGKGDVQGSLETPYRVFWNSDMPIWDNDDDRATLRDPDGKLVDEVFNAPKHRRSSAYM